MLGRDGPTTAKRPPASAESRQVVARRAPPAAPVPFERRETLLKATPGRPLDSDALSTLRKTEPERATTQVPVRVVTSPAATTRPTTEPGPARPVGSTREARPALRLRVDPPRATGHP